VGVDIVRGGLGVGGESDGKKRATTFVVARFRDALRRAFHFVPPPYVFPSPIPPSSEYVPAHIPLERGGAGAAAVLSAHPRVLVIEPTSLVRGEGLVAGLLRVVGRVLRCRG
jgi:hypothetical protein